jgi:hypothetical protein
MRKTLHSGSFQGYTGNWKRNMFAARAFGNASVIFSDRTQRAITFPGFLAKASGIVGTFLINPDYRACLAFASSSATFERKLQLVINIDTPAYGTYFYQRM